MQSNFFFSGFGCGIYVSVTWTHKAIELCSNKGLKLCMKTMGAGGNDMIGNIRWMCIGAEIELARDW